MPNTVSVTVHLVACCVVYYVLIKGYRTSYGVKSILDHTIKFQKKTSRKMERLIGVTLPDRLVRDLKEDQHYIAEEHRKVNLLKFKSILNFFARNNMLDKNAGNGRCLKI